MSTSREKIEHLVAVDELVGRDRLGGIEGEAAGEHGKPSQHGPFVLVEEVVTPRDRRLEGLLARHHRAAATREETEPIVECVGDAVRVHDPDAGCRELQRERQTVQPSTDARHRLELLLVGREPAPRLVRALHEERHCRRLVERRNPPRDLPGDTERLTARRHDVQVRDANEERVEHACGPVEHLLAVVEDEQRLAAAQLLHQGVDQRAVALLTQADRLGDGRGDEFGIPHRGEVDPPHPAGMTIGGFGGALEREPRLSAAPGAGQRDQPVVLDELGELGELRLAGDERRQLHRQVVRECVQREQRREPIREIRVTQLPHPLRTTETFEPVRAEIAQHHAVGQTIDHEIVRGARQHGLSAMGGVPEPRTADDRGALVVARIAKIDLTRVERHPDPHLRRLGPGLLAERPLHIQSRRERFGRLRERGDDTVALALLDRPNATVKLDRRIEQGMVASDRRGGDLFARLPDAGRSLDVGQQQRDRPGRESTSGRHLCMLPQLLRSRRRPLIGKSHGPMVTPWGAHNICQTA